MAEWNRNTPWRQGQLLGADALQALNLARTSDAEPPLAIVASHDCDLSQSSDNEPSIELFLGRTIEKGDGTSTHAKSARKLHLAFSGPQEFWGEFVASNKIAVDKMALNAFAPRSDTYLSPENQAIFQIWMASRYRRSAFPDEFERRLKDHKLAEKIAKTVKPLGDKITGVFFDVDEGIETLRNGADDVYLLDISILHVADKEGAEEAAQTAASIIEAAFNDKLRKPTGKWQHLELRYCEAISESVLSYQQFKHTKRWRLDHISLASDPQQTLTAE